MAGVKRDEGKGGGREGEDGEGAMGAFFVFVHGFQPFREAGGRVGSGGKLGLARSSSGVCTEFEPQDEDEDRPCSRDGTGCSVETVIRERETAARRREGLRTGCGLAEVLESSLPVEAFLSLSARLLASTEAIRRIAWRMSGGREDCS